MSVRPYPEYCDSGVEWLGDIPAGWRVARICELFREVADDGEHDLPVLSVSIHDGVSDRELADTELDQSYAFAWIDIKETRAKQASAFALLNDNDRAVSTNVTDAFSAYGITPVLWSRRDQVREELAA